MLQHRVKRFVALRATYGFAMICWHSDTYSQVMRRRRDKVAILTDRLNSALLRTGLNQSDIARSLNMSRGTVSRWFMGKSEPDTLELLAKLARELGVTIAHLVGEEEAAHSADEVLWLRSYREMTELQRQAFMAAISASTSIKP